MVLLRVVDLTAGYGKLPIIEGVNAEIAKKEVVALLGPNGSGKSTLIKSIMGFAKVFKGEVLFSGRGITGIRADKLTRMGIGYVPQLNNIFPSLTIEENLEMGAYNVGKESVKQKLKEVYQIFPELKLRRTSVAGNLSGGERQLLALARALMAEPKVLLLDEPTASLSPKATSLVLSKIKDICNMGVSILIAEQNVMKALEVSRRAYVLVSGRCVRAAATEELLSDTEFSKLYLGLRT